MQGDKRIDVIGDNGVINDLVVKAVASLVVEWFGAEAGFSIHELLEEVVGHPRSIPRLRLLFVWHGGLAHYLVEV